MEPTKDQVEAETGWHVWPGINGRWYASRPKTSPPRVVNGEDLMDLRDEIRRAETPRWLAGEPVVEALAVVAAVGAGAAGGRGGDGAVGRGGLPRRLIGGQRLARKRLPLA
jgi:hypothetical protein